MQETSWSTFGYSVDVTTDNSTMAVIAVPTSAFSQTVPKEILTSIGIVIFGIGICANSFVLAVLLKARRHFGSSVHTLIANQSAMDLFACFFGACTLVTMNTHGFKYHGNVVLDGAICVLFEGTALTAIGITAEIIGLIVITLERYFKIVHAIAHRKYYRNWMTSVGVALPWIGAACLILFPGIASTRVVNGRCIRMGVWPNETMAKTYSVVRFLWHYAIPVVVFVYCYGRIFHTIRRQSKVVAGHGQAASTAATSRGHQNTGQLQQQATEATTVAKLSHTELNVIKTMITVTVIFMIFWCATAFNNLLSPLGIPMLDRNAFFLAGSLAFITFTVNPFIYASRYEAFRRQLKQMMNRNTVTFSSTRANTDNTRPDDIKQHGPR